MSAVSWLPVAALVTGLVTPLGGMAVAPVAAVPLSPCINPDHGNPVVDSLEIGRARVEVSRRAQSVSVRVRAHDTGGPGGASGLASVDAELQQNTGKFFDRVRSVHLRHVSGDLWVGNLRIARWAEPDTYRVSASAVDLAGQRGFWSDIFGSPHVGLPLVVALRHRDVRRPVVTRFALSPTRVRGRSTHRRVSFSVTASDVGSGVASVSVSLSRRTSPGFEEADLRRVGGTSWVGAINLPRGAPPGRWRPFVSVSDRAQNSRGYALGDLPGASARPRSVVVTGKRDRTPPAVTGVSASPSTLDLRASASSVTVEVRLRDAGAGIATAHLTLQNPVGGLTGGPVELPMRRVAGTRHSGVWRAVWLAAPCDVAAGEWRMGISAVDLLDQGIDRDLGTSIAVQNVDRVPPTGSSLQSTSTSVPVAFSEDVVGVSVASAILQYVTGLFGATVTPVPGRWTCVDNARAPVDCLVGPVRSATFLPDAPLAHEPGDAYRVDVNPDHVLDLTDLAGNPAGQQVSVVVLG